jgi:methyltransferase
VTLALALGAVIFPLMIAEAALSRRHDASLRARGAVEPGGDVYAAMQVAYPGVFLAMLAEAAWRDVGWDGWFVTGLVILGTAKALKYWAISWLGERWTFRVLVPPGAPRVTGGPYAWMAHPNYVAVAGEIAGCAIAAHAIVSGPAAFVLFGLLMLRRIRVEERALGRK